MQRMLGDDVQPHRKHGKTYNLINIPLKYYIYRNVRNEATRS